MKRILLVNDDGYDSPGIWRLAQYIQDLGELWMVTPSCQMSGKGQGITFREKMQLFKREPLLHLEQLRGCWSIDNGTPANCVHMAFEHILANHPPELVLSGVNKGWNVGFDIAYSGTVGAGFEALLHGAGAMAFAESSTDEDHLAESAWLRQLVEDYAINNDLPNAHVININFPCCKDLETVKVLHNLPIAKVRPHRESYVTIEKSIFFGGKKHTLSEVYDLQKSREINDLTAVLDNNISVSAVPCCVLL